MPGISCVIPSWNSRADLARCLPSLLSQTSPPIGIHIIDNGSVDGTAAWIRTEHPQVDLVAWAENRGFSAACNEGIRRAAGSHVLILNADTWLDARCLERLGTAAEAHPDCALAPKILRADGRRLDSTGLLLRARRFSPMDRGEGEPDRGQYDAQPDVFGPTGAAALYPRQALLRAALEGEVFDESFFAYYEDVDLAWRLRRLGYTCRHVPDARVYHARKGPGRVGERLFARAYANRYLYVVKNATCSDLLRDGPFMALFEAARLLRLTARSPRAWAFLPLLLSSLPGALRRRRALVRLCRRLPPPQR